MCQSRKLMCVSIAQCVSLTLSQIDTLVPRYDGQGHGFKYDYDPWLTRGCFASDEIVLAQEPSVVEKVELLSSGQLPSTQCASETAEVVDLVPCLPHKIRRGKSLTASATLCSIPPAWISFVIDLCLDSKDFADGKKFLEYHPINATTKRPHTESPLFHIRLVQCYMYTLTMLV